MRKQSTSVTIVDPFSALMVSEHALCLTLLISATNIAIFVPGYLFIHPDYLSRSKLPKSRLFFSDLFHDSVMYINCPICRDACGGLV